MLTFREEDHTYAVEGKAIPCTSDILQGCGLSDYSGINPAILENARVRGSEVHDYTRRFDLDLLDEAEVNEEYAPYLEAWKKFVSDYKCEWLVIEEPIYSKKYWFATTPDRIGFVSGGLLQFKRLLTDVEIKCTAQLMKSFGPQTAAHAIAHDEGKKVADKIKRRIVVQLKGDGTYRVEVYDKKKDETVFKAALTIFNAKN